MLYFSSEQYTSLFNKLEEQTLKLLDYEIVENSIMSDEEVLFLAIILFNNEFAISELDFKNHYRSQFNSEEELNNIKLSLIEKKIILINKEMICIDEIHLKKKIDNSNVKTNIVTIIKSLSYLSKDIFDTTSYYSHRGYRKQIPNLLTILKQYNNELASELMNVFSSETMIFELVNQENLKKSSIKTLLSKIKQSQSLLTTLYIVAGVNKRLINTLSLMSEFINVHDTSDQCNLLHMQLLVLINDKIDPNNFEITSYAESNLDNLFSLLEAYKSTKTSTIKKEMLDSNVYLRYKFLKPVLSEVLILLKEHIDSYYLQLQSIHSNYITNDFLSTSPSSLFYKSKATMNNNNTDHQLKTAISPNPSFKIIID